VDEHLFELQSLARLTVLILIGTNASWDSVWLMLHHAHNLQELHLSLNEYASVEPSELFLGSGNSVGNGVQPKCKRSTSTDSGHGCSCSSSSEEDEESSNNCCLFLRKLMFNGNPITSWDQVAKLGG